MKANPEKMKIAAGQILLSTQAELGWAPSLVLRSQFSLRMFELRDPKGQISSLNMTPSLFVYFFGRL